MKIWISLLLTMLVGVAVADTSSVPSREMLAVQASVTNPYPVGLNVLPLPPGYPDLLQVSCGGVKVYPFIVSIDDQGTDPWRVAWNHIMQQRRRGSKPHVYNAYRSITWDFCGNYQLLSYDGGALDPTVTAVDAYGNTAYVSGPYVSPAEAYLKVVAVPPNAVCLQ